MYNCNACAILFKQSLEPGDQLQKEKTGRSMHAQNLSGTQFYLTNTYCSNAMDLLCFDTKTGCGHLRLAFPFSSILFRAGKVKLNYKVIHGRKFSIFILVILVANNSKGVG